MELSERLWKTVLACHLIWLKFRGTNRGDRRAKQSDIAYHGTNLCHAMRVVLVWVPLAIIVNVIAYLSVLVALIAMPVALFGVTSYVALFVVAAALGGGIYWMYRNPDHVEDALGKVQSTVSSATRTSIEVTRIDSLYGLVAEFIVATKQKICPMIRPLTKNGA